MFPVPDSDGFRHGRLSAKGQPAHDLLYRHLSEKITVIHRTSQIAAFVSTLVVKDTPFFPGHPLLWPKNPISAHSMS